MEKEMQKRAAESNCMYGWIHGKAKKKCVAWCSKEIRLKTNVEFRGKALPKQNAWKIRRCVPTQRLRTSRPLGSTSLFLRRVIRLFPMNDNVGMAKKVFFLASNRALNESKTLLEWEKRYKEENTGETKLWRFLIDDCARCKRILLFILKFIARIELKQKFMFNMLKQDR